MIDINTGRDRNTLKVPAVPPGGVEARLLPTTHHLVHLLTQNVVNGNIDKLRQRQGVTDSGGGVERVGIVLTQAEPLRDNRQYLLYLPSNIITLSGDHREPVRNMVIDMSNL